MAKTKNIQQPIGPPPPKFEKEEQLLVKKAQEGEAQAMTTLALLYELGIDRQPDTKKAAEWWSKGADKGEPYAQLNLALLLEKGEGVAKNPKLAEQLKGQAYQGGIANRGEKLKQIEQEKQSQLRTKILVVEDSAITRKAVTNAIEPEGYMPIEACDGKEALLQLKSHPDIALIITDLHMPVSDGFKLMEAVRKVEQYKHIPFIVITADKSPETLKKVQQSQATVYLLKPFKGAQILSAVNKTLPKSKAA